MVSVPETMTAIEIYARRARGPEAEDHAHAQACGRPNPGQGRRGGVNRPDLMQRPGFYPPPPGALADAGPRDRGRGRRARRGRDALELGDKVCALVTGGGYAQYCVAEEAIACPSRQASNGARGRRARNLFTVWHNVFERGAPQAASGSSCTAAPAASAPWRSSSPRRSAPGDRHRRLAPRSARRASNSAPTGRSTTGREDFVAACRETTGGKGVDVIARHGRRRLHRAQHRRRWPRTGAS